jgi:hypothetical protein
MGLAWCCRFLSCLSREAWFDALCVVLQNNLMHWKGSFKETVKHTIHLSWILMVMLEMLTTCWGHFFVNERPDYEVLTILDRRANDQAAWTFICNLTSRMSMCQPCSWLSHSIFLRLFLAILFFGVWASAMVLPYFDALGSLGCQPQTLVWVMKCYCQWVLMCEV